MVNKAVCSTLVSSVLFLGICTVPSFGQVTDLKGLNTIHGFDISRAFAINDTGDIVGTSFTEVGFHAFLYRSGTMFDLGTLGGTSSRSTAAAINNVGTIVGWSETPSQISRAFVYSNGSMRDLGTLAGTSSAATGINDNDQIVGYYRTLAGEDGAFLYSGGVFSDLTPGKYGRAYAINNPGQIVG